MYTYILLYSAKLQLYNVCDSDEGTTELESSSMEETTLPEDNLQHLARMSALFLFEIKEKYRLTQVAVQGMIEGIPNLIQVPNIS